MTLVNRLSLFFLAAVAVCLAGCSALTFLIIRHHLFSQSDQQVTSAINILVAATEVEPDGVKWQPTDHTIAIGNDGEENEICWVIVDQDKQIVDHSRNLDLSTAESQRLLELTNSLAYPNSDIFTESPWRYQTRRLTAPSPKPADERDPDESAEVVIVAAQHTGLLHSELRRLTWLVCMTPLIVWSLAAVGGRTFCARALAPVRQMSRRAQSMSGRDFSSRLEIPDRRDELAQLAESFNQLLDQLQTAFNQQRRFTGDAAHQLRTPLTVLRGQIDVALRKPRSDNEYRETLTLLGKQTEELQQMVETLLFLARTEAGTPPPDTGRVDVSAWLSSSLVPWKNHPRWGDFQISCEGSPSVIASPVLLTQALNNLIANAIQYSPAGSAIRIRAGEDRNGIWIRVEDGGRGVPDSEREAIFEPFYRTVESRHNRIPGTGLGLPLVQRVAQLFHGSVGCETSPAGGAAFLLRFPAMAPQFPETRSAQVYGQLAPKSHF
ncbi:ATP-binding protein [Planctomicrobium sp. SH664]|uniref:ATP-binding protein n=1 Tax=Planctomicrobium sp. SH664 TaxID=3448125 RepID=UPI003F5C07F6